ncbi:MAG: hypothetical protein WKH47_02005 [Actinomycetes bacterium]
MTQPRSVWSLGWAAIEGAVVGGLAGLLTYIGLAIVDMATSSDLVYGFQIAAFFLSSVVGIVLGVLAAVVGSVAARAASRAGRPAILIGGLAAGGAVGLAIIPFVTTWSLHPANLLVPVLLGTAIAAWRLRAREISERPAGSSGAPTT